MDKSKTTTSTVATRTASVAASTSSRSRRRRPQEFLLPDGRKILVALPEEAAALRDKYSGAANPDFQVEVVVHGSPEHQTYLRESHAHHSARREALRQKHGGEFEEWERTATELESVSSQLERLADHSGSLGHNFSKFGYSAHLRTYGDEDGSGSGSGMNSSSASLVDEEAGRGGGGGEKAAWDDRRGGSTIKLFKKPVVKQYFHRGLLWRASEETSVLSFELFFDLLYVGIIAINGDHVSEEADAHELLRFIVTFGMSYKIWTDLAQFISWFESDDILQRLEFLFLIACLLGLTTNMLQTFNHEHDTYIFLVAFYLAARLFTALYCALTAFLLPLVKGMMISQIITILISAALWIGSTQLEMPDRLIPIFLGLVLDIFGSMVIVGLFRYSRAHLGAAGNRLARFFEFYPAINIEHKVERTNAFVTLVLGYSVVGVIFQNQGYGANAFLGKAVLGLVQAFIFNWLYFEVDGANIHVHAIRRSVWSASLWQYAHLFFIMSFILSSAALSRMVLATDCANAPIEDLTEFYQHRSMESVSLGLRLYYSVGLGIALFSTLLISWSHTHKFPPGCRLSKPVRLLNRLAVAVIMCALPAAEGLSSLSHIAITVSLMVWVLLLEIWGTSCRDDTFFGEKGACCYTARCTKKQLDSAMNSEGEVDVHVLSRSEKRGAAMMD